MPEEKSTLGSSSTPTPTTTGSPRPNDWFTADLEKEYPTIGAKFKGKPINDFVKSYANIEKYQGGSIRVPQGDEGWDEVYSKLGRPESADKYDIKFADGTTVDERLVGSFREAAHSAGLSQKQASALAEWYAGQASGMGDIQAQARETQFAEWDKALKDHYGYKYDGEVDKATRTFSTLVNGNLDHPLAKLLDESGLGNHPELVKLFASLADKVIGEDKFVDETPSMPSMEDKKTAQSEARQIRMSEAWLKESHPGHKEAIEKLHKLYEIISAPEE